MKPSRPKLGQASVKLAAALGALWDISGHDEELAAAGR